MHAARVDRDADSSIGGVNGKKAVSVYLGIGLGWLIAAVYHSATGQTLQVHITRMGFALSLYILFTVRPRPAPPRPAPSQPNSALFSSASASAEHCTDFVALSSRRSFTPALFKLNN